MQKYGKLTLFLVGFLLSLSPLTAKTKSLFQSIQPNSFTPVGKTDLAYIDTFSSNYPISVLKFDYSPLNTSSAVTTFKAPLNIKKNKIFVVELDILTQHEIEPIKGRVAFGILIEIIHQNGEIEKIIEKISPLRDGLQVHSANANEIFNDFKAKIKFNAVNIQKKDIINLKLIREYKVPDSYQGVVSIQEVKIYWNVDNSFLKTSKVCNSNPKCFTTLFGCQCPD